jgi:hypothetical protein
VVEVAVMRVIGIFALVCLFSTPCTTFAQEAPVELAPPGDVDVPPGPDTIVIATRGVAAPISGQLFDHATALRWGNRIVRYRMQLRLLADELSICRTVHEASTSQQVQMVEESYLRQLDALRADIRSQASRYETQLQQYRSPPFYETWAFGFAVGVVVTGIISGAIAGLVASVQ